jgi:hypothetical protein
MQLPFDWHSRRNFLERPVGVASLNRYNAYQELVTAAESTTAVRFLVSGGPATCEVYHLADGEYERVGSETISIPGHVIAIGPVQAGSQIRVQIIPLDRQLASQTNATVTY